MLDKSHESNLHRSGDRYSLSVLNTRISAMTAEAQMNHLSTNDLSKKIDILLCLITYQNTMSLLNAACLLGNTKAHEEAIKTYELLPDYHDHSINFDAVMLENLINQITDATILSLQINSGAIHDTLKNKKQHIQC